MANYAKELLTYTHPHYIVNIMLSVAFYVLKVTPPFCLVLFEDCQVEIREMEMLTFLGCVIVMKNRKVQSVKSYLATVCAFSKALTAFLFFRQNPIAAIVYVLVCLLHIAFLPEPAYKGPDYVTYFSGESLEEEIRRDKRVTWLVEFYAAWQPTCVEFSQTFARLSAEYSLDNLKFGKVDVTRNKALAERFRVDHTSFSRQLPTLVLIQNGKEAMRRPMIDSKCKPVGKFVFTWEKVVDEFRLNDVYHQCKKNPIKKKSAKENLNESVEAKKDK